jgi:soluble lytic murein transglycosylase-like protein
MQISDELAAVTRRMATLAAGPNFSGPEFGTAIAAAARDHPDPSTHETASASRGQIQQYISEGAAIAGVDPALVEAIVENESGFNPGATSSAGARGLMQLMPQTAQSLGVIDPYDPAENVRGGARYLRSLLDRFGSVELAVAAYNAGPSAVARYRGVPPFEQTRNYVRNVLTRYHALRS